MHVSPLFVQAFAHFQISLLSSSMEGLLQCPANFIPLSPISFLKHAAVIYGDRVSIIYGTNKFSWSQTYHRCLKLSSALVLRLEISPGDIVAAFAPNIPALYELHFAVPMVGAVISALNILLDPSTLASIIQQLEPKVIFVDYQFLDVVLKTLNILSIQNAKKLPRLVLIPEMNQTSLSTIDQTVPNILDYDELLSTGDPSFTPMPNKECSPISVNYTSGSTGKHKGVVYSHRATYLNSIATISRSNMQTTPVFLWTVDMFRCNGWCFVWAMAAIGGTNICLRKVSAEVIFDAVLLHKVTLFCGAPAILKLIAEAPSSIRRPLPWRVSIIIAGAFPVPDVLIKVIELGFDVSHGYGMTEALGPAIIRPWKPESKAIGFEVTKLKCGEALHSLEIEVDVKEPTSMKSAPNDGKTLGEIMFRGNTLMSGYLKNPKATREAFEGEWFRTGDLAVRHPNGSLQMKDRAKDIIISGEETISSVEIEAVLLSHPKVLEAAVVGKQEDSSPDTPCAFVKMKHGCSATATEIVEFCGRYLPPYMLPRSVVFGDLPQNANGKVQKFVLREMVKSVGFQFFHGRAISPALTPQHFLI